MNKIKILIIFFVFFLQLTLLRSQNPNVVVKCSEVNNDYIVYSESKIKSVATFEVSKKDKKDKKDKKITSKVWYSLSGCPIKSIYYSSNPNNTDEYTKLIADYNSLGNRTKFEKYSYTHDSVSKLLFSEFVEFDSNNRIKSKKTEHHTSDTTVQYLSEEYKYDEQKYILSVTQNVRSNTTFPYSVNVYKYLSIIDAPAYSERINYFSPNSYSKSTIDQAASNYYINVEDGKTTQERKIVYEKNFSGNILKEITIDLMTNKKTKEIIYHNTHEYEVINYDIEGNKTNSYTERLPYSDPVPDRIEIGGYSYDSLVKKDTVMLKNGGLKVHVFEKQYVDGKIQDKLSQTLEYNKNKLIIRQDVEYSQLITEYEYEYY